ncbi:hypothetical protein EJC49_04305 [Aquibium carbonis]|uniref:Uncharacterized protein n=1 Tax=Aquibium carbonis TaxID=2495581 RepID=A0A429Z1Y4_9HYPH|nr:type II toxin-antitoxin system VapC family toxin [Aquibium carbonis]RST87644.1 hypothetical protein EJC49_04305 [Aquibium carbonis]
MRPSRKPARPSTHWLNGWAPTIVDISAERGNAAVEASSIYGKIVGHPAALNFGDCFVCGCAKVFGVPLICKGDDFSRTDLA